MSFQSHVSPRQLVGQSTNDRISLPPAPILSIFVDLQARRCHSLGFSRSWLRSFSLPSFHLNLGLPRGCFPSSHQSMILGSSLPWGISVFLPSLRLEWHYGQSDVLVPRCGAFSTTLQQCRRLGPSYFTNLCIQRCLAFVLSLCLVPTRLIYIQDHKQYAHVICSQCCSKGAMFALHYVT